MPVFQAVNRDSIPGHRTGHLFRPLSTASSLSKHVDKNSSNAAFARHEIKRTTRLNVIFSVGKSASNYFCRKSIETEEEVCVLMNEFSVRGKDIK